MAAAQPAIAANARPPKGWLGTLVVALLMVGIVGVGFIAQNSVADIPARSITVDQVAIVPASGWDFAGRSTDLSTVLLTDTGTGRPGDRGE